MAAHVFETLVEAGAAHGLKLCGLHAMNSCRLEKAFRHFGHDITDEDHVLEAGLGFAVKTDKGDFLGREAVLRKRAAGLSRRLMQVRLTEPDAHLHHNEPLLRDGRIVGYLTSGGYGHALGGAIGLGYVPCAYPGESAEAMLTATYAVEIAGRRIPAEASLQSMYDPRSLRPRA
jgi:glycine cleavage system aminomethyltransferase T